MNGSPSSRQRATPVASTRLSPRGRPRSSHSPIRLNGRTASSSEPWRRAARWSYRISSRCLKRGMLLSSIIAGPEINIDDRRLDSHNVAAGADMKIAVITDAHANLPALRAALEAIRAEGCDAIFHTGDAIGIGPFPAETLELLLGTPHMQCVTGNHDAWFVEGLPQPH